MDQWVGLEYKGQVQVNQGSSYSDHNALYNNKTTNNNNNINNSG